MSITDWFTAREARGYVQTSGEEGRGADLPDGVWVKCETCKRIVYARELGDNLDVCPHCGHHGQLTAHERVALLVDERTFQEFDANLTSSDPLAFNAAKPYTTSLASARETTGLADAVVTGRATIAGHPVIVGAMDFRFIGASMGSVVGEKVARAFEVALAERRAVVLATASGGARMQEGVLSLMQMAKTSAAVRRHGDAGLLYIVVLTHPTMGGVAASFAALADVTLAEPGAQIGFTGPRVIEQTIRQKVPKAFQSAEFQLEHGMIDAVVNRKELEDTVALVLDHLLGTTKDVSCAASDAASRAPRTAPGAPSGEVAR